MIRAIQNKVDLFLLNRKTIKRMLLLKEAFLAVYDDNEMANKVIDEQLAYANSTEAIGDQVFIMSRQLLIIKRIADKCNSENLALINRGALPRDLKWTMQDIECRMQTMRLRLASTRYLFSTYRFVDTLLKTNRLITRL